MYSCRYHTSCLPRAKNAVEIWLQILGRERHDHVLALLHLVARDDAEARRLERTRVQQQQPPPVLLA